VTFVEIIPSDPSSRATDGTDGALSAGLTPGDTPSPAELAFIERVRGDREQARRLLRRTLAAAAVSLGVIAAVVLSHGLPRWSSGEGLLPDIGTRARQPNARSDREALEERIAHLEARLEALESRPAVESNRPERPSATANPAPAGSAVRAAKAPAPTPDARSVSPLTATLAASATSSQAPRRKSATAGQASPGPGAVSPSHVVKGTAAVSPTRVRSVPAEPSFGDHVRRGWETLERGVRRTPDAIREGVVKVTRLFAD
jgi:hypothetical protein